MFVFVRIWTTNGFTICSSSVETKPSLFCSFCFRRNFQGIILILFLSQPSLWNILQVETFSAFFIFTKFSLQHILYSFKPQFSIIFFASWFGFFIFFCFLVFLVFIVVSSVKAGWAQWWHTGRIHHNRPPAPQSSPLQSCSCSSSLVSSLIVFLDLSKVKSFSFGLSGIDWSNSWAREIYSWTASLTMLELAMALLTRGKSSRATRKLRNRSWNFIEVINPRNRCTGHLIHTKWWTGTQILYSFWCRNDRCADAKIHLADLSIGGGDVGKVGIHRKKFHA